MHCTTVIAPLGYVVSSNTQSVTHTLADMRLSPPRHVTDSALIMSLSHLGHVIISLIMSMPHLSHVIISLIMSLSHLSHVIISLIMSMSHRVMSLFH